MADAVLAPITNELIVKFVARVDVRGPDDCWPWAGKRNRQGYATMYIGNYARLATHYILAFFGRPRPKGMEVLHSCDNPPCCNPAHLSWGTRSQNAIEACERGLMATGEKSHYAKLKIKDVIEIRASNSPNSHLAKIYNIDKVQVWRIRNYKSWKHI